jgi:hypothetical protein
MSEDINRDILVALKALLWIKDNPHGLTYGITDPVQDFARRTIERAEFREENRNIAFNGVPEGWYDDVKEKTSPHPLALLASACEARGKSGVLSDYGIVPADLDAYIERTAISGEPSVAASPSSPKP